MVTFYESFLETDEPDEPVDAVTNVSIYESAKALNPNFRESTQWLGCMIDVMDFIPPGSDIDEDKGIITIYDANSRPIDTIVIGMFLHKDRDGNITWSRYL